MLSNLQTDDDMLLQIMFVGQPQLLAKLKSPSFSQLAQRITVNYHLMPLTHEETCSYIHSRLEKVGGVPEIFTADAIKKIYFMTKGIPRLINLLCDSALVYAYSGEIVRVDETVINRVIEDKADIGLVSAGATPGGSDAVGATLQLGGGLAFEEGEKRIEALEAAVQELKMQVQWQIEELEKRAENFKDDLIRQLRADLEEEKKKHTNSKIILGRLQKDYLAVKDNQEDKKEP
jgi:general secretion pathway protein A